MYFTKDFSISFLVILLCLKNDTSFRKTTSFKNECRVAQDSPTHRNFNLSANKAATSELFLFSFSSSTTNTSLIQNGNVVERRINSLYNRKKSWGTDEWIDG